jgi:predicted metalloprotease with PDZ domain
MVIVRLLILFALAWPAWLSAQTHYIIDLAEAKSGWLTVSVETACKDQGCSFEMPAWNATYQIRDFAQYVYQWRAESASGTPIVWTKSTPSQWLVAAGSAKRVRVQYRVLADRPGPFGAVAEAERVILNLGQVLVVPLDARRETCTLRFRTRPPDWKTAISIEPGGEDWWTAASYDRLIDTPVVLANFEQVEFDHRGSRIRIVVDGERGSYDIGLLEDTVRKVVAAGTRLMDDVPFKSYTFVYRFSDEDGGGMEYRDGTVMYVPANCRRCDLSSLTAHEFFHAWNVKRIRPLSMEPVDFSQPQITGSLWFAEGVTSSYAQFIRRMAGQMTETEFVAHLTRLVNTYEARPAKLSQSALESSIEAWLERYPPYGRTDRSVSYYLRGELIGYLLDLIIRERTDNQKSLDDVMRELNRRYAQRGLFFDDLASIEQLATEIAGVSLVEEFDKLVRSAAAIDWNRYLGYAGYRLASTERTRVDVGFELSSPPGQGIVVARVAAGSPAEKAGFRRGDRIVRLAGRPAMGGALEVLEKLEAKEGRKVSVDIERGGAPIELSVEPRKVSDPVLEIVEVPRPTPSQLRIRAGWLDRTTEPAAAQAVSQ